MIKKFFAIFKNRPLLIVGLIFIFWAILNLIWVGLNKTEPHLDMTRHLYNSLIYDQEISIRKPLRALVFWIDAYQYYPPFVYVLTKPFYIFGNSTFAAISSMMLWLAILLFGLYGVAKRIWNEKTGLIAVLILAATPIFIGQSKEYMLDLPLAAWVILTIYLLLKTDHFQNQFMGLILGLVLGLGMLIKWTYPAFIIFPLIYILAQAWRADWKDKRWSRGITSIFVLITAAAIAFPWYYIHRLTIYKDFLINGSALAKADPNHVVGFFSWIYYPIQGLNFYFFLPLGLLIVTGLILSITAKKYQNWLLGGR